MQENLKWYKKGLIDGIPIALGYFAVAFALGILSKKAGLSPVEAASAAALTLASAGGYAGFAAIAAGASYLELALTELVVNARYLLMSFALSQKMSPKTPLFHRFVMSFGITDEIFGISSAIKGDLNPFYNYGAMTVSIPGWALGTLCGAVMGNVLPQSVVTALGVGIYGMFLAIIIPKARENKVVLWLIVAAMALSFAFSVLPVLKLLSSGLRVIVLTVVISLFAAIFFPVAEEECADE